MKPSSILLSFLVILTFSCKQETKKETTLPEKELTTAQKIANAHGYKHWKEVNQIKFTFNTSRSERSWTWEPKTQNVTLINKGDTISYNRTKMDSIYVKADQAFINDKFWFLAPFQLIWDKSATISAAIKEIAPISKTEMNKITITYPSEGGYTPGDAYDFYFGDDYIIREWIYRSGNSAEPTMITTWEGYEDFNGIKLATMHKKSPEDDWKLWFTGISVTTE